MCIDLYLTFTNPLYPMERRLRIYFAVTIVIPLILMKYTNGILTTEPKYIEQYLKPIWDYRNFLHG